MKTSSRVMSMILVAALLMTGLCVSAFAASGAAFVGTSDVLCEGLPCYEVGSTFTVKVSSDAAPAAPTDGAVCNKDVTVKLGAADLGTYTGVDKEVDITPVAYGKNTITSTINFYTYDALTGWSKTGGTDSELNFYAVKKIANAENNSIEGITEPTYKRYLDINFTAVGDGMDNEAPVKGDTRYRPAKYSANLDEHVFGDGITSGTYSHNGTGTKTLKVTFDLEQFDGSEWVKTGAIDEKEISYESVSNGSYVELIMAILILIDSLLSSLMGS